MKHLQVADKLLSDSLFSELPKDNTSSSKEDQVENQSIEEAKKDPLASKVWRLYTKAKNNLPNGVRMENLTWRMMAMTLSKKKKQLKEKDKKDTDSMMIDNDESISNHSSNTTPPPADDTTSLLSSSAPPYAMDFLHDDNINHNNNNYKIKQQQELINVMVSGSTRASTSTEIIKKLNTSKHQVKNSSPPPSIMIPIQDDDDVDIDLDKNDNDNIDENGNDSDEDGNDYAMSIDNQNDYSTSSYTNSIMSHSVPTFHPPVFSNQQQRTILPQSFYQQQQQQQHMTSSSINTFTTNAPMSVDLLSPQSISLNHLPSVHPHHTSPYFYDQNNNKINNNSMGPLSSPSTSSSSTATTTTGTNNLPLGPITEINPGSLSFEEILSVYYDNNNNNNQSNKDLDANYLLNLQSVHLSGDTPSPSSPPQTPQSVDSCNEELRYQQHVAALDLEDEQILLANSTKMNDHENPVFNNNKKKNHNKNSNKNEYLFGSFHQQSLQQIQPFINKKSSRSPSSPTVLQHKITSSSTASMTTLSTQTRTKCSNCATTTTPLWRRDPQGQSLCNACGLFLKLHGIVRPLSLKTNVIKKRNRSSNNNNNNNQHNNNNATQKQKSKQKHEINTSSPNNSEQIHPNMNNNDNNVTSAGGLVTTTSSFSTSPPSSCMFHHSTKKQQRMIALNLHKTFNPTITSKPNLINTQYKRQRRLSSLSDDTVPSTFSSIQTNSIDNDKTMTSLPPPIYSTSLSSPSTSIPFLPYSQTSSSTTFSSSTKNININNNNSDTNQQSKEIINNHHSLHQSSTNVYSILESIGSHLNNLPPELLPLIASAANYHAMTKQRQQQQIQTTNSPEAQQEITNLLQRLFQTSSSNSSSYRPDSSNTDSAKQSTPTSQY